MWLDGIDQVLLLLRAAHGERALGRAATDTCQQIVRCLRRARAERVRSGANANTPVFIAHGSADEIVLPECGAKAHELMTAAGVPSTFNVYEGVQHSTSRAQMQEAKDWIQEQLKL